MDLTIRDKFVARFNDQTNFETLQKLYYIFIDAMISIVVKNLNNILESPDNLVFEASYNNKGYFIIPYKPYVDANNIVNKLSDKDYIDCEEANALFNNVSTHFPNKSLMDICNNFFDKWFLEKFLDVHNNQYFKYLKECLSATTGFPMGDISVEAYRPNGEQLIIVRFQFQFKP